jgi:drug/metabolite transporter (DMT)-like permease
MLIIIIGMTTFCFSPLFHMKGLSTSLATENAIIVAMEPLVTIFLAWLLLKETVSWFDILGFGFALLGFGFLAGNSPSEIGSAANVGNDLGTHLIGNLLIVCSILGESSFTLLGKKLVSRYSPISVFGSAMAVGFMGLTVAVIGMTPSGSIGMHFEMFTGRWHWKTVFAALWIGPLGTTAGYLFYLSALADTSVVAITLFLFLQPLAGAFMGYLFLNERLHEWQGLGSFFILIAILLPNAIRLRRVSALSAQI